LPYGTRAPVLTTLQVVGGGYRRNARCPICRCLDRERLVYLTLRRMTGIFQEAARVLHVAPERQLSGILKSQRTVDYLTADLRSAKVMVRMDVATIPFPDEHFDGIVCNHVRIAQPLGCKALAELCRVLKPSGWAILQVPISLALEHTYEDSSISTPAGREATFGQRDHLRIYARDYKDRLEGVGFKVDVFRWTTSVRDFGGPRNRFGLNEKEAVYFVTK